MGMVLISGHPTHITWTIRKIILLGRGGAGGSLSTVVIAHSCSSSGQYLKIFDIVSSIAQNLQAIRNSTIIFIMRTSGHVAILYKANVA